jgi:hypothetical protein
VWLVIFSGAPRLKFKYEMCTNIYILYIASNLTQIDISNAVNLLNV